MKSKIIRNTILILGFLYLIPIYAQQRWNHDDVNVGPLKGSVVMGNWYEASKSFYINVGSSNGHNFELRRPRLYSFRGCRFIRLLIEDRSNGFEYEILEGSGLQKRIKLKPGRYKVTLTAELTAYYSAMNGTTLGSYDVDVRWYGLKD